jgi:hypothetical protein
MRKQSLGDEEGVLGIVTAKAVTENKAMLPDTVPPPIDSLS